jgi:2-amino-4-hydroxy-6-hydroxymethyldihydropteridine diphosphokinase
MELDKQHAYLLLGSNLGDSKQLIEDATMLIEKRIGTIVAKSSRYATAAWGKTEQPPFINLALQVCTDLEAFTLLTRVLEIEKDLGRVRMEKWGARLIDIDVIFYGNHIIDTPELTIPHPLMHLRKFVILPLNEIATSFEHPILKKNIDQILSDLPDDLKVERI